MPMRPGYRAGALAKADFEGYGSACQFPLLNAENPIVLASGRRLSRRSNREDGPIEPMSRTDSEGSHMGLK